MAYYSYESFGMIGFGDAPAAQRPQSLASRGGSEIDGARGWINESQQSLSGDESNAVIDQSFGSEGPEWPSSVGPMVVSSECLDNPNQ